MLIKELIDIMEAADAFVVYHDDGKFFPIKKQFATLRPAEAFATKLGADFKTASFEWWSDNLNPTNKNNNKLNESALDTRFNTQLDRVQGAINNLRVIVDAMLEPQSSSTPVAWQKVALVMASKDLKEIYDKL